MVWRLRKCRTEQQRIGKVVGYRCYRPDDWRRGCHFSIEQIIRVLKERRIVFRPAERRSYKPELVVPCAQSVELVKRKRLWLLF